MDRYIFQSDIVSFPVLECAYNDPNDGVIYTIASSEIVNVFFQSCVVLPSLRRLEHDGKMARQLAGYIARMVPVSDGEKPFPQRQYSTRIKVFALRLGMLIENTRYWCAR